MFINSLTAFFAFTSFISPIETGVILLITAYTIYMLTLTHRANEPAPMSTAETRRANIYMYLQSAWLGKLPLAAVFFPFLLCLMLLCIMRIIVLIAAPTPLQAG
ncbi:hypothetical protein [Bathymodiolus japonicus methanotrophic gill symbiont]|uniref:hypothetical protein n=1 Tax=Bathymodiolus japonicus methanotrophic gill symbiont TaxID=113269 RepID=UPI001C8D2334|nr:hypothetical protein [Bathymodiolus japonicus methanotrophic gill symbiont]